MGDVLDARRRALVDQIRQQCLKKGCGGIKQLSTMFRRMDYDFSKCICYRELNMGVKAYGLNISDEDLHLVFDLLDRDKNGSIDFCEFMQHLRPPMTEQRIRVINEAFDKLDVDKNGQIEVDDLRGEICIFFIYVKQKLVKLFLFMKV
ncbi:hypothetical protein SNE40_020435 [Patella caerulea]|uniref:EF-hand domain-containing protein n=1 Tax=Patella caerulea TaxID=87958 RepID=A0AAN8IZN7_PATCE